MAREKKQVIVEEPAGAPEWMVTFSDCMTLLLTFFVLLLSFSSFDDKVYNKMQTTMLKDLDQVFRIKETLNAAVAPKKIVKKDNPDKGSEKPTISEEQKNSPEQTPDDNFRDRKVFICPSSNIFWGTGDTISGDGMEVLDAVAAFFAKIKGKIVLSENGTSPGNDIGLVRSLNVLNYLTEKGVKKERLNVSVNSVLSENIIEDYIKGHQEPEQERRLEIVILERGVFN